MTFLRWDEWCHAVSTTLTEISIDNKGSLSQPAQRHLRCKVMKTILPFQQVLKRCDFEKYFFLWPHTYPYIYTLCPCMLHTCDYILHVHQFCKKPWIVDWIFLFKTHLFFTCRWVTSSNRSDTYIFYDLYTQLPRSINGTYQHYGWKTYGDAFVYQ